MSNQIKKYGFDNKDQLQPMADGYLVELEDVLEALGPVVSALKMADFPCPSGQDRPNFCYHPDCEQYEHEGHRHTCGHLEALQAIKRILDA